MTDWFLHPYDGDYSFALVCAYLGFDPEAWAYWVTHYVSNPRRKPAFAPWARKLNAESADTIRALLRRGERTSALAVQYRVDGSTIRKIRCGHRWRKHKAKHH